MNGLFEGISGERLRKAVLIVVVVLAVFLGLKALAELQGLRYIGAGIPPANTITISGHGETFLAPDIATFTFSVVSEKSTVAAAQADATAKANAVTEYLKGAGVEDRDIQTSNYNIYPQYDYETQVCLPGAYCPGGKQVLRGYEVRQTTTVKVRETDKAGELLAGVGSKGATEVSGLNFTFDDPNKVQEEARAKAIADAKKKADILADQLGVRIVRVVSFSESSGGYYPYNKLDAQAVMGRGGAEPAAAPEISIGENKISIDVSVTYEIR